MNVVPQRPTPVGIGEENTVWDIYNNLATTRDNELISKWSGSLNSLPVFVCSFWHQERRKWILILDTPGCSLRQCYHWLCRRKPKIAGTRSPGSHG
jgi:hypothetical protein